MRAGPAKLLLLGGALILFVLLFLAPKKAETAETKAGKPVGEANSNGSVDLFYKMADKSLKADQKARADLFEKSRQWDSLISMWTALKRPDLAAFVSEKKAAAANTAQAWSEAGNRYYYSVQFSADKSETPLLYQSAIRCFERAATLNPADTDSRIMLASAIIDGSADPMKGVTMLREISKTDSNNVKLQMTFAAFSVKSGQLDKAIGRFQKVLRIDSNYIEAYLHLADAYEQTGDREQTIAALEQYAKRTNDITSRLEVMKYIQQLKENN